MVLHQCPECNKSFKDGEELYYHINDFHMQIPSTTDKKCPRCDSEKFDFLSINIDGMVSLKIGIMQGKKHLIYFCDSCKHLFEIVDKKNDEK